MRDLTPWPTALRTPGCSLKGRGKIGRFPAAELTTNGTTVTTTFTYDAEGKLASASNGTTSYSVLYDGDGNKISTTINGTTTILVGNYYEWTSNDNWKKYYSANGQNIAVRDQTGVQYLYGDNLASVRGWSNSDGTSYGSQSYMPWGEDGTSTQYGSAGKAISDRKYTGQKSLAVLGIYDYNARYYDPYLNRFLQPDSIIPDPYNPLSYDRYAYAWNSPTNFNDPTGHAAEGSAGIGGDYDDVSEDSWYDYNLYKAIEDLKENGTFEVAKWWLLGEDDWLGVSPIIRDFHLIGASARHGINPGIKRSALTFASFINFGDLLDGGSEINETGFGATNEKFLKSSEGAKGPYKSPFGYPSDPSKPPAPGFEWRGSGNPGTSQGNWVNPVTGEWFHWDPTHHNTPHFDYNSKDGNLFRIWPDGSMSSK